jgi:hypothetical protein
MLGTGCWLLVAGYLLLVTGYWIRDSGLWLAFDLFNGITLFYYKLVYQLLVTST